LPFPGRGRGRARRATAARAHSAFSVCVLSALTRPRLDGAGTISCSPSKWPAGAQARRSLRQYCPAKKSKVLAVKPVAQ
jgi:hypothetical protein